MPATAPDVRLRALDGLRGIAALGVALFAHYVHFGAPRTPFSQVGYWPFHFAGWLVELFFVLSGFVFSYVYRDKIFSGAITLRDFVVFRVSRLYPLHVITLVFVALVQPVYHHLTGRYFVYEINDAYHFLLHLGFIQNGWVATDWSFNAPSWSVSVEILTYLVFFGVLVAARSRAAYLTAFALLVVVGLRWPSLPAAFFNPLVARVLITFFLGCLIYEVHRRAAHAGRSATLGLVATAGVLVLAAIGIIRGHAAFGPGDSAWMVYRIGIWPLLTLAVLNLPGASQLVGCRPLSYLGDLSYSIYMLHFPIQLTIMTLDQGLDLGLDPRTRTFFLGYAAALLVVGSLSYHLVERPARGWLRRRLTTPGGTRQPVPVPVAGRRRRVTSG